MSLTTLLRRIALPLFIFVVGFADVAQASHFRFAHHTWRRISDNVDGSVTVEFTLLQAWRLSAPDILGIDFGDGESFYPSDPDIFNIFTGSDLAGEGYVIRRYVVQHTYSAQAITNNGGIFLAESSDCCRIGSLINAGSGSERIEVLVDLNTNNQGSPVSSIPVILQMSFGQQNSLSLGVADPQGEPLNCRMASSAESEISSLAEAAGNQLTVSQNCVLSWDLSGTTLADVGSKYAAQVVIEESNRCGQNGCGRVGLDFIIEIVQGNPPTCQSDKQVNNTLYVNVPFTANFTGSDTDPGATLTLSSFGAPAGATLSPDNGTTSSAPMSAQLSWTPGEADRGSAHAVLLSYQDETGLQGVCSLSLQVSETDPVVTCDSLSIMGNLFAMDGSAHAQRSAAKAAAKHFLASGGSSKEYKNFVKDAEKLYIKAWIETWTIPGGMLSCPASDLCSSISTASLTGPYLDTVGQLDTLIKKIINKIKSQGQSKLAKSLGKTNSKAYAASVAAAASVPGTQSSCLPGVQINFSGQQV